MKILLASEEITNRPREGSLVFLMHLSRFLHREGELTVVHAVGEFDPDIRSLRALSPKTLVTRELLRIARRERFDVVLYVPLSGLTAFGIARGALLRFLAKSPTITIGLQERRVGRSHALLSAFGKPDLVLSPVSSVRERLERLGFDTGFIMPGYDDRLFRPVSPEMRAQLKSKYDLPRDRYVLLHVGHIKESRNLEVLLRYRDWGPDVQPVVKAGEIDPSWAHRLRMAGIIVIDEYYRRRARALPGVRLLFLPREQPDRSGRDPALGDRGVRVQPPGFDHPLRRACRGDTRGKRIPLLRPGLRDRGENRRDTALPSRDRGEGEGILLGKGFPHASLPADAIARARIQGRRRAMRGPFRDTARPASSLVVLSGLDGSGKSTQTALLAERLGADGIPAAVLWNRWKPFLSAGVIRLAKRYLRAQGTGAGRRLSRLYRREASQHEERLETRSLANDSLE